MMPLRSFFVAAIMTGFLSACVTIIVNFPAEAAEEKIEQLIEQIYGTISDGAESDRSDGNQQESDDKQSLMIIESQEISLSNYFLEFFISSANAEVNFSIDSPQIKKLNKIQKTNAGKLQPFFRNGAVGFGNGALLAIRDISKIPAKQRSAVKKIVAQDNQAKNLLYKEIARQNGNPGWASEIRKIAEKKLIKKAKSNGWWYQNSAGVWSR